jgi:hypothetical protein
MYIVSTFVSNIVKNYSSHCDTQPQALIFNLIQMRHMLLIGREIPNILEYPLKKEENSEAR